MLADADSVQNFYFLVGIHVDQKYVPPKSKSEYAHRSENIPEKMSGGQTSSGKFTEYDSNRTVVAFPSYFSGNLEELDERVMALKKKSENFFFYPTQGNRRLDVCTVCGKEGSRTNIKDHIEAAHLEGIVIPCNICEKSFRSRSALRHHIRQHKMN